MSEMSYLWSAPSEAGDGAALYTRADWSRVAEILAAWRCLTPGQRALLQRAYAAIETFRNPDASDDEALDAAFLVLDLPQVLLDEAARVRQQSE